MALIVSSAPGSAASVAALTRLSDVLLVLVGPRYGARQQSGLSATEEEFDEARRRARSILVLRQEIELEPVQQEFLERAFGGWEGGSFLQHVPR